MVLIRSIPVTAFIFALLEPTLPLFHKSFLDDRSCDVRRNHWRLKIDSLVVYHIFHIFHRLGLIFYLSGVCGVVEVSWLSSDCMRR